ncbi:M20 family metallopeptidase [Allosediminivita pacifica]|uniref:Acetylornithine deacetylase/succinyl-diaminopimelate desuccinylase-like protein n=1 Tax=Allosediminivita pacifica TaxID=1267769 RepID=A0A2T6AD68_9RHOB|nr:M20/M25/M40 family metallo-hydrolase [Allosediminivita pacifica]PTX41757.1 acetylornithine deacetylase/succinyl-diaminopimelate desuccinylase-like protein [Allosediminivita pacifica]
MKSAPAPLLDEALALTARWCAIPSHAGNRDAQGRQVADLISWLTDELGAEILAPLASPGPAPVIHARLDAGARHSVILYNMYDVMPADPEGWQVDPWTGGRARMADIGEVFIARGAENNKGPLAGMLTALRDLHRSGALDVNVEILLDGEEEQGSPTMRHYLAAADCPLPHCIGGLFPSLCEYGGGAPRLYLGFSGITKGRIHVAGGDWGGPRTAIHSSNAPWIANPARVLVDALSGFGGPVTGELGQVDLDAEALDLIAALARDFDPEAELQFRTSQRYTRPGDAETLLRHVLRTASLNISSLTTRPAGDTAVIPPEAEALFDLRTPPGLEAEPILATQHLRLEGTGVRLETGEIAPGVRFGACSPGATALRAAYSVTSEAPQIWPWAIGSAPGHAFAPHADSFLIGGAGRGGNAHGTDEFLTIEGFGRFIASVREWLLGMGKLP